MDFSLVFICVVKKVFANSKVLAKQPRAHLARRTAPCGLDSRSGCAHRQPGLAGQRRGSARQLALRIRPNERPRNYSGRRQLDHGAALETLLCAHGVSFNLDRFGYNF